MCPGMDAREICSILSLRWDNQPCHTRHTFFYLFLQIGLKQLLHDFCQIHDMLTEHIHFLPHALRKQNFLFVTASVHPYHASHTETKKLKKHFLLKHLRGVHFLSKQLCNLSLALTRQLCIRFYKNPQSLSFFSCS